MRRATAGTGKRAPRRRARGGRDRHGAERRVGRLLAGRHLVHRKELEDPLTGGGQPRRSRRDVADITDAPTGRRRTGEQRDEESRPAAAGHRLVALQAKCRSTRSMPSANVGSGGSRLTITNDSRGKSKKYPGCASTPSVCSIPTTRSSSVSSDGTCITPYHPPSLCNTRQAGARPTEDFR